VEVPGPEPEAAVVPAARRRWTAFAEARGDLRGAALTVVVLGLTGLPAGLVWWWLAPRADFRIESGGPVPIGPEPSPELVVGVDVVFTLVLAGLGLLAGLAVWFLRRRRGVASLLALAVGTAAAGVLAWQLGGLLRPSPTAAELAHVGARVTTGLELNSLPALAVGPFVAVLVYVLAAVMDGRDDLGPTQGRTGRDVMERPPAGSRRELASGGGQGVLFQFRAIGTASSWSGTGTAPSLRRRVSSRRSSHDSRDSRVRAEGWASSSWRSSGGSSAAEATR
jgi:LPXTG-motif cell wall-anchored protein